MRNRARHTAQVRARRNDVYSGARWHFSWVVYIHHLFSIHPRLPHQPPQTRYPPFLSGSCHDSPHHTTNSTVCSLEFQDLIPASSTQLTEVLDLSYNSNCTYLYTACLKPNPSSESFPRSRTSSFQSYPQFPRRPSSKLEAPKWICLNPFPT